MSIASARRGRHRAEPLDERLEPDGEELRLEPGADLRVGRQRGRVDAARDGPQVEPGAADEDREPAALPIPASASRAWAAKSATVNGSSGSTRSSPWCGMPRRSSTVAFAVPMSRPR